MINRTRSTNTLSPTQRVTYVHTDQYGNVGNPYTYGSGQSYTGTNDSISDENHPGYLKKRNQGELVLGSLVLQKYSREMSQADFNYGPYLTWGTEHCWGDFAAWVEGRLTDPFSWVTNDLARMKSVALAKAYANVNSSTLCTAEYLKEAGETLQMLKHPFRSSHELLRKIYRKGRRGSSKRTAAASAKAMSDSWLEYRYGWQPILLDMSAIMKLVSEASKRMRVRLVSRASQNFKSELSKVHEVSGGLPRANAATVTARHERDVRVAAGVIYEVQPHTAPEQIMATLGLRARDLPPSLWNLIPFSFVVDWFVNVEDWLQAVMPVPQVSYLANWVTTVDNVTTDITNIRTLVTLGPSPPTPAANFYGNGGTSLVKTCLVTRDLNQSIASHPVLTFQPLSIRRQIDAISLASRPVVELLEKIGRSIGRK